MATVTSGVGRADLLGIRSPAWSVGRMLGFDSHRWLIPVTLSTLWLRKQGDVEELVIATDSRLTGGRAWDCCPKILVLPRSDSAICFAGDTDNAYPLLIQAANTVHMHPPALDRSMDLHDLRGHLVPCVQPHASRDS